MVRSMVFGGFSKCLYPQQKLDSDSERRFSVILENDGQPHQELKPARRFFDIDYRHDERDAPYDPDFVVQSDRLPRSNTSIGGARPVAKPTPGHSPLQVSCPWAAGTEEASCDGPPHPSQERSQTHQHPGAPLASICTGGPRMNRSPK